MKLFIGIDSKFQSLDTTCLASKNDSILDEHYADDLVGITDVKKFKIKKPTNNFH